MKQFALGGVEESSFEENVVLHFPRYTNSPDFFLP